MKKLGSVLFCFAVITTVSYAGLKDGRVGMVTLQLQQVNALHENGSPAPRYSRECMRLYGQYLGKKIKNQYYITQYSECDDVVFNAKNATLYPAGLAGQYSFLSDGLPTSLSALRIEVVTFTAENKFKHFNSGIMFSDPIHSNISCLLTGNR